MFQSYPRQSRSAEGASLGHRTARFNSTLPCLPGDIDVKLQIEHDLMMERLNFMNPVRQELDLNFDFINRKAPLMTSPQGISVILQEKCSAIAQTQ